MSQTKFVEFREDGFWAYDVGLAVFLKHLIDVASPPSVPDDGWLVEAVSNWRVIAVIPDYGLTFDGALSPSQIATLVELADRACEVLGKQESFSADEIESWELLEDLRIFPRGAAHVQTGPVVELGRAVIALLLGRLPAAPSGRRWFYGVPEGRTTIGSA